MTKGWDEIKAAVHAVVLDVLAVQAALISEVLLKLLVDVVSDWLPAKKKDTQGCSAVEAVACSRTPKGQGVFCWYDMYHSVLFTASPNPGVSTMVSLSLTPFSSISTVCLVISTVCVIRSTDRTTTKVVDNITICPNTSGVKGQGVLTFSIEQLPIFVQICEKETVDQGGLTQARLPFRETTERRTVIEFHKILRSQQVWLYLQPWAWSQIPSWLTSGAPGLGALQNPHILCPGPARETKVKLDVFDGGQPKFERSR